MKKGVYIKNPSVAKEVKRALRQLGVKFETSRTRNVAAGFYDDMGIFHPIRASYDYSAKRAGESKSRKRKARKSKSGGKKKSRSRRRGRR